MTILSLMLKKRCLNRFQIRALVGTDESEESDPIYYSLNPFQIRALVGTCAALIIFLMKISLNPFQIRALVGTQRNFESALRPDVLIPFKSGLWLER